MKNKLTDLNNHLFAQMERLGNEELTEPQLASEIERSKAITLVAKEIINNGQLVLDAKVKVSNLPELTSVPKLLE